VATTFDGTTVEINTTLSGAVWAEAYRIVLGRTYAPFAQSVYDELMDSVKSVKADAETWEAGIHGWLADIESVAPGLVKALDETTLADALGVIQTGLDEGLTDGEIRERLSTAMKGLSKTRADRFAATETRWARNFGEYAGAGEAESDTDLTAYKTWAWSFVSRQDHAAVNGERIRRDESFTVGGETCRYPHDMSLSASQRVSCSCYCLWSLE